MKKKYISMLMTKGQVSDGQLIQYEISLLKYLLSFYNSQMSGAFIRIIIRNLFIYLKHHIFRWSSVI